MENLGIFIVNILYGFISHEGTTFSLLGGINTKGDVVSVISIFSYAKHGTAYSIINFFGWANGEVKTLVNFFVYSNCASIYSLFNLFSWSGGGDVKVVLLNIFAYAAGGVQVKGLSIVAIGSRDKLGTCEKTKINLGLFTFKKR